MVRNLQLGKRRELVSGEKRPLKLFLEVYGSDRPGGKRLSLDSVFARIHPDDRLRARAAQRDTIKGGLREGEVDYRIINPDGSMRWVQDKWTIIRDADGQAAAIEGFIRDNTRRRQAEEEFFLRRKEAEKESLEKEKLEAILELAAAVGHELNNPPLL